MHTTRAAPPARILAVATAGMVALAGCMDRPTPLAPEGEAVLSSGGPGTVDVIVVLKGGIGPGGRDANRGRAADVAQGLGLEARHTYGAALFGFAASVPAARLEELGRNPLVAHVELDRVVSLPEPILEPSSVSVLSAGAVATAGAQVEPWGVTRTGARESGSTGAGVSVYVLDTGIDPNHPDLVGRLGEGYTVFGTPCRGNPKNCPPPPTWHDDHGHGTHVAGTVGAADNGSGVVGVAPGVTLHAVKVLGRDGFGSWSGIIAGIDWVAGHNADRPRVANMSLGGTGWAKVGTCTPAGLIGSTNALHSALCNARNAGVVFTVSAGNTGGNAADLGPAAYYDAAITVSATSCAFDEGEVVQTCVPGTEAFTTWSSWGNGSDTDWLSEGSLPVAIAAPGASVLSTRMGGGYVMMSGTSMAAPHVAGGAARVLQSLAGGHPADYTAFATVRAALMGASECTETWHNVSGNPHTERFLNLGSPDPINECVEPGDPPPTPPSNLRAGDVTSTTIALAWDHVTPESARFQIWQYTDAWDHLTYVDGTTSHLVEGLSPGTAYRYAVRTVTDSQVSGWSNILYVTTLPDESSNPPVARFIYTCDNSDTCRFTDHSSGVFGADPWDWDFGNGETSAAPNPSVTYAGAGSYEVTLRITDTINRQDEIGVTIHCRVRGNRLRCE